MKCLITSVAVAAALMTLSPRGAHAQEWCGYGGRAKSIIECGYSSNAECENAIGKGGMCFVDPEYARARKRSPVLAVRIAAGPA
jgi:hypothetical protein